MLSERARWGLSLGASVALNVLVVATLGRLWLPWLAAPKTPPAPRTVRIAVYTPPRRPTPPPTPKTSARPKPKAHPARPKPHRRVRRRLVPPRPVPVRATPQAPSPRRSVAKAAASAPSGAPSLAGTPTRPQISSAPAPLAPAHAAPAVALVPPDMPQSLTPPPLPPAPDPVPTPPSAGSGQPPTSLTPGSGGAGSDGGSGGSGASGSGAGSGAGSPFGVGSGGSGTGEGPRHIVYVLDISGSMTSRIDASERELRDALATLRPGESFDLIAFSDDTRVFDHNLVPATPRTVAQADRFLSALEVGGGTNLEAAMTQALSMLGVNVVYLITDGVPRGGEENFDKLARLIRRRNRNHARIYTVGLVGKNPDGTDDSFEAARLLRQIARESGGQSKLVPLGVAVPE